jgi:phosphatidylethanolamine-binding protein (PEBP) family uncharacterized protein
MSEVYGIPELTATGFLQLSQSVGEEKMMRAPILAAALVLGTAAAFADELTVTTPAFKDGGTIPLAQVCDGYHGGNQSPALSWSGEPAGTKSFTITMYDPDAPSGSGF